MASLSILIKTNKDTSKMCIGSQSHNNLKKVANLINGLNAGALLGSVDLQYSSSDPVAAAGSVAITYASVANNDTITLGNQTLTCVTGTPTTGQFKKETDATQTATNLKNLINSHSVLSLDFIATSSTGTVTITCLNKGYIGNHTKLTTSNGTGFGITAFASGTGGAHSSVVTIGK